MTSLDLFEKLSASIGSIPQQSILLANGLQVLVLFLNNQFYLPTVVGIITGYVKSLSL